MRRAHPKVLNDDVIPQSAIAVDAVPANAGIQFWRMEGMAARTVAASILDSRMRGNDEKDGHH